MVEIATIDATKSGVICATILDSAKSIEVEGSLCEVEIQMGDRVQSVLCRLGAVDCINVFHENPNYKPLIANLGHVPHFSGVADVLSTELTEIACVDLHSETLMPRLSPPKTGTRVKLLEEGAIDRYLNEKGRFLVVGHLPNKPEIPMSVVNRHHGDFNDGGYGEAKHTAIFGQNGSGKTVFVCTLLAGKLAANPMMGCLIPDTAGDISRPGSHNKGSFQFSFLDLLDCGGRDYEIVDVSAVCLKSKTTYKGCLQPLLRTTFGMHGEKAETLANNITEELFDREVDISKASATVVLGHVLSIVESSSLYAKANRQDKVEDVSKVLNNPRRLAQFESSYQNRVGRFFEGTHPIDRLVESFLSKSKIILLQLYSLSDSDQQLVMAEIFKTTKKASEIQYKTNGKTQNAIVVLDEGARWVPQERISENDVAKAITDAFNTTRKYGIGWTIITQRLTSIDKNVIAQCHTRWVGRGVGIGADRANMESFLGKSGMQAYDRLQRQGGYFWIGAGHEVNFGTGDQFMTLVTYGGNSTQKLIDVNPHIW